MNKKGIMVVLLVLTFIYNVILASAATLCGDLNNDGKRNSTDYVLLNRHILDITPVSDLSIADVTGDGKVNSTDYATYKRFLLEIITVFPAETAVPSYEPSPTPETNPEDAWKENLGTINLDSTITYTGKGISVEGTTVNITAGGDHEVTGTLNDGMIYVNTKEKVKLRLSGASITNSSGPAIYFADVDKAFITITAGTVNSLTDGSTYSDTEAKGALFSNDDIEIKGKGTLNITGNYKHGISCDDDIKIENGTITITAVTDGINANNKIKISGGDINITAGSDGIDSDEVVEISGGTVTITAEDDAVHAELDYIVSGGVVNIIKGSVN